MVHIDSQAFDTWPCFLTGLHTNLCEQHALGLKVQTQAMALVIQKVLQTKELDCTQVPPIPPVHTNVQLSGLKKGDWTMVTQTNTTHFLALKALTLFRLVAKLIIVMVIRIKIRCIGEKTEWVRKTDSLKFNAEALVPGIFAEGSPVGATDHSIVQLQHSADLSWGQVSGNRKHNI